MFKLYISGLGVATINLSHLVCKNLAFSLLFVFFFFIQKLPIILCSLIVLVCGGLHLQSVYFVCFFFSPSCYII